ncbi:MAG: class I SAM-dependent methyltransferase [Gemmatimonadota bacterium]
MAQQRSPEAYAEWYRRPRGAWIGQREFALLRDLLDIRDGEELLDVGCGTGYFTGSFAEAIGGPVVGLDPNVAWVRYARRTNPGPVWVAGIAQALPFADRSFDATVAVTSLCFIKDERIAVREMMRVTRGRIALGLLNRNSLLWREKGRGADSGSYAGARWHTPGEARDLVTDLGLTNVRVRTAVFHPSGGRASRAIERLVPARLPLGAFLAVVGDVSGSPGQASGPSFRQGLGHAEPHDDRGQ